MQPWITRSPYKRHAFAATGFGVERELEDVRGLDQLGAARTGEQIAAADRWDGAC
jgi:hypothetical protein